MTKETEKKARRIAALVNEKLRLDERVEQVDAELETLCGGTAGKPAKAKKAGRPAKAAAAKGSVALPCCGAKSPWRHKNGCAKRDGSLPPDTVPLKWACTSCFAVERSEERPEECVCGSKTFVQKR